METYKSDITESSTRRFLNKLGQSFKKTNIPEYSNYYNSLINHNDKDSVTSQSSKDIYNYEMKNQVSILPLLQSAGLQLDKLHEDVVDALNNIIIENHSIDNVDETKFAQKLPYQMVRLDEIDFVDQASIDSKNIQALISKHKSSESNNEKNNLKDFNEQKNQNLPFLSRSEKLKDIVLQSEIYGDFDSFHAEKPWKTRKKQYNFKEISKNDILSEHVLKSIDDVLKIKLKERDQVTQLIGCFDKFLTRQNKIFLNKESVEVIEIFMKILEIENYNSRSNSQIMEKLQNFIFGAYVREGTIKKCHLNLLATSNKVDTIPVDNNNNIDLSFYYEELGKVKKNFQEDSKNYADYISQGGSIFILNWIAECQKVVFKTETAFSNVYLKRYEYLNQIYPDNMIKKLYRYKMRFEPPKWQVFDMYLVSPILPLSSEQNVNSFRQSVVFDEQQSLGNFSPNQHIIQTKMKKPRVYKSKMKAFCFDEGTEEDDLNTENLNVTSSIHCNLETSTAVENGNKENQYSPSLKYQKQKRPFKKSLQAQEMTFDPNTMNAADLLHS
ncbi:hypothetical protein QEN19_004384 [Hanseniaspora menglaensis]